MRPSLLVALLLVPACFGADGDGDGGLPGPTPVVELGTGSADYQTMTEEQELGLVAGPQGGYHFIVHARMKHLSPGDPARPGRPENPSTVFEAWVPDGTAGERQLDVMNPPYRLGYEDLDGDGWLELPSGRILQMDLLAADLAAFYGTRVRIVVRITDSAGRIAEDERHVIARPWTDPTPDAGVPASDAAQ